MSYRRHAIFPCSHAFAMRRYRGLSDERPLCTARQRKLGGKSHKISESEESKKRIMEVTAKMSNQVTPNSDEVTVLLIGGLARSGTTCVTDIVNECPDVAVMAEYRLTDLVEHLQSLLEYETEIERLALTYDPARRIPSTLPNKPEPKNPEPKKSEDATNLAGKDEPLQYEGFGTPMLRNTLRYPTEQRFPAIVTNVVGTALNKPKARIIGSKSPGSLLQESSERLRDLFPRIRYIALLRSPMEQINSSINRRNRTLQGIDFWHEKTVDDAIDYYTRTIAGLVTLKYLVNVDLLFLKFEELLTDQKLVSETIFSYIGTDWRPEHDYVVAERGGVNVLTPEEREQVQAHFGDLLGAWDGARLTGADDIDLAIFNEILPPIPENREPMSNGSKPQFLTHGWSVPEADGIWTDGERAIMLFGASALGSGMLRIEFSPYLASGKPLGIEILFNGEPIGKTLLCHGSGAVTSDQTTITLIRDLLQTSVLWIGPVQLNSDKFNLFEFRFTDVTSPAAIGESPDPRLLGLRLSALQFVPVD